MIDWRDSDTYMAIIDEGQEKALKGVLLRQEERRFGPPNEAIRARIIAITEDIERLERLTERILTVASWEELLHDD